VSKQEALEVLLASFRAVLARGLHECFVARGKLLGAGDDAEESGLAHVSVMLDAFLQKFVAEPTDRSTVAAEGSVRASDVQLLANTHFPLCMRRIDRHLRQEGHVKHTGRFSYGLFLKQIGLSKDDAMILFSTLMTVKGGGSIEAFAKSEYGYNVRHNYGLEGKKTSYSSMSCATIVSQPPNVDRHDCHGCPFRFRDEAAFRLMLGESFPSPLVADAPKQRLLASEIEDIVKDAKEMHYTRACFRYFTATHPNAKRDTLFRSPGEYYEVSRETRRQYELAEGKVAAVPGAAGGDGGDTPARRNFTGQATKRTLIPTEPVEGVIRPRTEQQ
jgi:DNA primase large subunit